MKNFFGTSVNVGRLWVALVIVFLLPLAAFSATTPQVSAGQTVTAGLKSDGTVLTIIGRLTTPGINTSTWTNITQIANVGGASVVGLKSDGTVVATGDNINGQCNVSGWTGIVQVAFSSNSTFGLKSDGTVVATGNLNYGQSAVLNWTGIKQISAGFIHVVGLKYDGTVVHAGTTILGLTNVSSWSDITQISAGGDHTVGLKSDGTVVAAGENDQGQCNVSSWTGITQVSAGNYHTVGLKSDGTAVAVGLNTSPDYVGQCNVQAWTNLVQVSANYDYTVGLKSDGTVVGTGSNYWGQLNGIEQWNLGSAVVAPVMVAVPNVVTLTDTVAETEIEKASLQVGSWDSNYSSAPKNTVISQVPAAGTKVSKGSAVKLTLSLGAAPVVTYEATATLRILNQKNRLALAGVTVTTRDKNGYVLQVLTTDANGTVTLKMPKAGKVWIYEVKTGYTPMLYPDVKVINKGAKNVIVSYMMITPAKTAPAKKK